MSFSITTLRADIHTALDTVVFPGQTVYKQSIPDTTILSRTSNGLVEPYVSYALGDLQQWGATSMIGARGDDYVLPLYLKIAVPGSDDGISIGEQLYDRCINLFLGQKFDGAGEIRKRAGGSQFPIKKTDGSIEAIIFPVSFGIVTQLLTTP